MPFSDKPEKSSIYQDVKTETLQELTADQFDTFRARMFAEGVNGLEDEYRRLLLLGLASDKLSTSGPIPETSVTAYFSATNSGTKYTIFEPNEGEVWLLGPCSFQVIGASGSVNVEQWLYAGDNIDGTKRRVLVGNNASSSSTYSTIYEGGPNMPVHVDSNGYVAVEATGTFTEVNFFLHLIRVR